MISGGICVFIDTLYHLRNDATYLKCVHKTLFRMWMEALGTAAMVAEPYVMTSKNDMKLAWPDRLELLTISSRLSYPSPRPPSYHLSCYSEAPWGQTGLRGLHGTKGPVLMTVQRNHVSTTYHPEYYAQVRMCHARTFPRLCAMMLKLDLLLTTPKRADAA